MIIPWETLSSETLHNIIESFVLREGTDYGLFEKSLAQKVQDIQKQLELGEVVIVWSELHDSVSIINKKEIKLSENVHQ